LITKSILDSVSFEDEDKVNAQQYKNTTQGVVFFTKLIRWGVEEVCGRWKILREYLSNHLLTLQGTKQSALK